MTRRIPSSSSSSSSSSRLLIFFRTILVLLLLLAPFDNDASVPSLFLFRPADAAAAFLPIAIPMTNKKTAITTTKRTRRSLGTAAEGGGSISSSVRSRRRRHQPQHSVQSLSSSVSSTTQLFMSLKPAAVPLLDSGKSLAISGERLIDVTSQMGLYGGSLSGVGACLRNAGDRIAQAAASCRFKTASELVCDELREGASCLLEAAEKLRGAVEEARSDNDDEKNKLATVIETTIQPMSTSANTLESAGAAIMQRRSISDVGTSLFQCGEALEELSIGFQKIAPDMQEGKESYQRMMFAAERMREAGNKLRGMTSEKKPKGKAWIKG